MSKEFIRNPSRRIVFDTITSIFAYSYFWGTNGELCANIFNETYSLPITDDEWDNIRKYIVYWNVDLVLYDIDEDTILIKDNKFKHDAGIDINDNLYLSFNSNKKYYFKDYNVKWKIVNKQEIEVKKMSRELEAFSRIMETYGKTSSLEGTYDDFLIIKKALQRLESIDNAKPNEALEVLDKTISPLLEPILAEYEDDLSDTITANYFALKQALIKAQKQEAENEKMKKLLLELSDISPDNIDCIYQCKCIVNKILEANISTEINKSCKENLKFIENY